MPKSDLQNSLKTCDELRQRLEHLRPIEKKHLPEIQKFWQIGLTYSSNALEGNTLTESETKVIIEDGLTIGGKSVHEHLEALGHRDAVQYLYEVYKNEWNESTVMQLHRLFYFRINEDQAGQYRRDSVIITGTDYIPPPPKKIPALMANFAAKEKQKIHECGKLEHPILKAAHAHEGLVNIHPFIDGNGRTARLLMNLILLQHGYPVVVVPPIVRARYIEATKAGNKNDSQPFQELLAELTQQALEDYLRMLDKL